MKKKKKKKLNDPLYSCITDETIDSLLASCDPKELLSGGGLLNHLAGRLVERALEGELTAHLGYEKHETKGRGSGNSRNGATPKTLKTPHGEVEIQTPRDRDGSFEPQLIKKRQTRLEGLDEKVIALYARGMSTRQIRGHLEDLYGVHISPDIVSQATESVVEDVKEWQNRALDEVYPIVYMDALVVKIRDEGTVRNKHVYLAVGVTTRGTKEVLGLWIERSEGAKFWLKVLNELKTRGVQDILVACVDGLKGFPDAIEAVFPQATVQTCIVHMIRNSLRYVSYKHRRAVAKKLKPIYTAANREEAELRLEEFDEEWGKRYPMITQSWRTNWERVVPFLDFPPEIRKVIYTTNAIEAVNSSLRKLLSGRGHFPSDVAVAKLIYLGLLNFEKKWARCIRDWNLILGQFVIYFPGRIPTI